MLVIGRRPGESIVVGTDIEIEVLEASASQVRLGIRAPRAVAVVRKEILLVGEQNRAAAALSEAGMKTLLKSLQPPAKNSSDPRPPDR